MNIKEKVLLIEDERTIRSFMQAILTANGYDVLMAGTGAMADTMISSHCPDIIILDLGGRYKSYCSDTTRTLFTGTPTEEMKKIYA